MCLFKCITTDFGHFSYMCVCIIYICLFAGKQHLPWDDFGFLRHSLEVPQGWFIQELDILVGKNFLQHIVACKLYRFILEYILYVYIYMYSYIQVFYQTSSNRFQIN